MVVLPVSIAVGVNAVKMKVDDLLRFGFSRRLVECWRASGLDYLLPLQAEAIRTFGILQGSNLLISGPTSSGKTFCGELAAVRSALNNRKAIFMVPLKALASEKYQELKKRYRKVQLLGCPQLKGAIA